MRTRSLTHTLIAGVLLAELLCAVCFSGVAVMHELDGRRRAFDIMLRGRVDSVLGAIQDAEDPNDNVMIDRTELALPQEDIYEVTTAAGKFVGGSPGLTPDLLNALSSQRTYSYFNFKVKGKHYRALEQPGMRVIDREENGGFRRPVKIIYAAPTYHLWHETVEAVRFYVIASLLLLLLTGFLIAWFLRRSMSPLRELALRAERVSEACWEFDAPAEVLRTRELEPIASSIQKLLNGLRTSFERQRQFTGDAAHELKTSIAVLKSSVQLLSMRERTAQEYHSSIEGLLMDTERMEDLTTRMLMLARAEQALSSASHVTDLSKTLRVVVERLQPIMQLRRVRITLPASDHKSVRIEPESADVLCSNLLMNALQHSTPGSEITVCLEERGDRMELLICDEGKGIPQEALPHIFERFYRADPSRSRANGGAGLGLAICKAIVDRCGGSISISSAQGLGTRAQVVLPGATASPAQ